MNAQFKNVQKNSDQDYYVDEQGNLVMTKEFLKKRGFCCGNGCRHCPYPAEKGEE